MIVGKTQRQEKLRQRDFRRQIVQQLKVIQQRWPECPAILTETRAYFLLKPTEKGQMISTTQGDFNPAVHVTEFALVRDSVRGGAMQGYEAPGDHLRALFTSNSHPSEKHVADGSLLGLCDERDKHDVVDAHTLDDFVLIKSAETVRSRE